MRKFHSKLSEQIETERQRQSQTERQRQRHRDRDTERDRDRERQRQKGAWEGDEGRSVIGGGSVLFLTGEVTI